MYQSMLKTYANKYKTKTSVIRKKFSFDGKFAIPVKSKNTGLTELRFFLDLKFTRNLEGVTNPNVDNEFIRMVYVGRTSLIDRMQARKCEYCGMENTDIEIHHIRKLKDVKHKASKTPWEWLMIARNRKTLAVCKTCHADIHAGEKRDGGYESSSCTNRDYSNNNNRINDPFANDSRTIDINDDDLPF